MGFSPVHIANKLVEQFGVKTIKLEEIVTELQKIRKQLKNVNKSIVNVARGKDIA